MHGAGELDGRGVGSGGGSSVALGDWLLRPARTLRLAGGGFLLLRITDFGAGLRTWAGSRMSLTLLRTLETVCGVALAS